VLVQAVVKGQRFKRSIQQQETMKVSCTMILLWANVALGFSPAVGRSRQKVTVSELTHNVNAKRFPDPCFISLCSDTSEGRAHVRRFC
jgi:hypothetical protein